MKKTVFIILILLVVIQTNGFSQKKRERFRVKADTVTVDSLEYRLIILDPGFEVWLMTKPPKYFYSKEYYEHMNRQYVSEWNYRFLSFRNDGRYDEYLNYDPNIDYGLDLNYRLYYYFKFFEETNKVKLYQTGR